MQNYFKKVSESAAYLREKIPVQPKCIVVLSGGLEAFVEKVQKPVKLLSTEIPHFPKARAEGHKGELIFGLYDKLPVAVLKGRYHYYEGLTPQEVVFPYFVLHAIGAKILVTTNAVGGVRADLNSGDLMLVEDHINMMGTNPLIGLAVQRKQDQFTSMQNAYDAELRNAAEKVAQKNGIELKKGVYLANPGPSYETPAEIKVYRSMGGDTVGMSTLFEVIAARFLQMRVLTLNIITNPSSDRHTGEMKHEEVLEAMKKAQKNVVTLLDGVAGEIANIA